MTGRTATGGLRRYRRGDRRFVVWSVSIAHFLSHVYLLAYPPLFVPIGRTFDLSTAQLGLLVTAIYLPTLVLQIPVGEVVDRVGAKRILVAGLVVSALGVSLSGLAPTYRTLLALALVSGVGQSAFHPADYALLESVTDETNQGSAFGLHTFGGFAGFAAAPVLTGALGVQIGWRVALVAVGVLGVGYAAALLATTEPVYRRSIRDRDAGGEAADGSARSSVTDLFRVDLLVVCSFYVVSMMAIVALQSFTSVFAIESLGVGESAGNTVLTAYLVGTAVGVVAGGPLSDRLPPRAVILAAFGLAAVGVWGAVLATPLLAFSAALAIFGAVGLLIGAALPARDALANSLAEADSTGKSFGFFFTGVSLGAVVSPAAIGALIDALSVVAGFVVVGAFLAVAAAIVLALGWIDRVESPAP